MKAIFTVFFMISLILLAPNTIYSQKKKNIPAQKKEQPNRYPPTKYPKPDLMKEKQDQTTLETPLTNLQTESKIHKNYSPLKMVEVEGGAFLMGTNLGDSDEMPVHEVRISSFLIGQFEITQEVYASIMGSNPSNFKALDRPVEQVTWYDAVEFCNRLSENEGLRKVYSGSGKNISCDFAANGYRLPTEAEWEFAAKGGKKYNGYKFSGSDILESVGWYGAFSNSGNRTRSLGTSKVGEKNPNALKLFDMSGNVWEWCWDWKGDYSIANQSNPNGYESGTIRVLRGGSWFNSKQSCSVASRGGNDPSYRGDHVGFRVARTLNK